MLDRYLLRAVMAGMLAVALWLPAPAMAQQAAAPVADGPTSSTNKDPALVSVGLQFFDRFRKRDHQPELRLEYRGKKMFSHLKPFGSMAALYCMGEKFNFCQGKKTTRSLFMGGGFLLDIFFGRRIVLTPSLGANLYMGGNEDLDLDYPLIFREQVEISYRFDDYSRLGIAVSRYENFGLGETNPAAEGVGIYYSFPFD